MNKVVILILLFFLALSLFCQPAIKFDSSVHDFGEIKEEMGPHTYRFIFHNVGETEQQIKNVKSG